jgi:hypothetical protein
MLPQTRLIEKPHETPLLYFCHGLANGLPGAHSQAMEYILSKIVDFLIALGMASMIAFTLGLAALSFWPLPSTSLLPEIFEPNRTQRWFHQRKSVNIPGALGMLYRPRSFGPSRAEG